MSRGLLISFEGCEGSGKTTQADVLSERLTGMGRKILRVREPGGTKTGEVIRGILQHDSTGEVIEAATEALLFAASRAQMVKQVVVPALEAGEIVISDRYVDSAVAYQGYGREMGPDMIECVNSLATGGVLPDVTFLLDVEVQVGMQRIQQRNLAFGVTSDRIEREDAAFHERVRSGYLAIAGKNPGRFIVLDGKLEQGRLSELIWSSIEKLLPGA